MTDKQPAVIDDIYDDPRVPADAYRPTFVRSLAMVPVGDGTPFAAIGCYWARHHRATEDDIRLLSLLAGHTVRAMARFG
jgi:GAF domain-containing protein